MNTQLLKEKAKEIYSDKYDLSKVEYVNPKTRIIITCPIHGDKSVFPYNFLKGRGCYECGREEVRNKLSMSTETFIEKASEKHKWKYVYEKTNLDERDENGRVCIICPIHGEFWQTPSKHLSGCGCQKCKNDKLRKIKNKGLKNFIEDARKVHGDKYDYSKVKYIDANTKVCIICPIHGEFWQTPNNHLQGQGCPKCNGGISMNGEEFIRRAKQIHGDKYDYSKVVYVNNHTKVCIICPIHGEFWQTPQAHLRGQGCKKCKIRVYDTQSFIQESIKKYGNLYDYGFTKYENSHTKVLIKCNKCGNTFEQTPNGHLKGRGCPFCKESRLEKHIRVLLDKHNIEYETRKHFDWLGLQHLDFYLPKYNIGIECQGKQHFESVDVFGGEEEFIKRKCLDKLKYDKCIENKVKLLYFTNLKKYTTFLGETLHKTDKSIIESINEKKLL